MVMDSHGCGCPPDGGSLRLMPIWRGWPTGTPWTRDAHQVWMPTELRGERHNHAASGVRPRGYGRARGPGLFDGSLMMVVSLPTTPLWSRRG